MTESNQWKAFERTDGMQISNSKKDCSISFLIRKGCWPYSHHFDIGFYSIMNEIVNWFSLVQFQNVPSYPLHGSRDGDELGTLDGCLLG
jgi:hypothetical protein